MNQYNPFSDATALPVDREIDGEMHTLTFTPFQFYNDGRNILANPGYGRLEHRSRFGVTSRMIDIRHGVDSCFAYFPAPEQRELAATVAEMVLTCDPRVRRVQESPLETLSR